MINLKQLMFDKGLNQLKLGKILKIKQPEVSKLINGRRDINETITNLLIEHFGKDTIDAYTTTYDKPKHPTDQPTATIIPAEVIEEIKEEIRDEVREEVAAELIKAESIPFVSPKIANDSSINLKKFIEKKGDELEQIKPGDLVGNANSAERVRKTSMMPTFMPGDIVFVQFLDNIQNITDGHIYYFKMKTRPTMIRKTKIEGDHLRLIAENPNFGDIITPFDEIINVAEIVGMFRSSFGNQYAEIEALRAKKEQQIDNLIDEVRDAGKRTDRVLDQNLELMREILKKLQ